MTKDLNSVFEGPFSNWVAVSENCSGYDDEKILNKVLGTALKVKKGDFAFERDSVGFKVAEYEWHLVANILLQQFSQKGPLNIMDFGGSLGSSYFQHLALLSSCKIIWHVIEQPRYVEAGRKHFQSENLKFHKSINQMVSSHNVDIVLLSSVLQYLEEPKSVISQIIETKPSTIIIDKTIVNISDSNKVYLQNVPPSIYDASYPCRSFSETWLLSKFLDQYDLVSKFSSLPFPELESINSAFKGYIFKKKE